MIVEIRTYRLKPGTSQEFVRVMQEEAGSLLAEVKAYRRVYRRRTSHARAS